MLLHPYLLKWNSICFSPLRVSICTHWGIKWDVIGQLCQLPYVQSITKVTSFKTIACVDNSWSLKMMQPELAILRIFPGHLHPENDGIYLASIHFWNDLSALQVNSKWQAAIWRARVILIQKKRLLPKLWCNQIKSWAHVCNGQLNLLEPSSSLWLAASVAFT